MYVHAMRSKKKRGAMSKYFFIHHHLLIFHYDTEYGSKFLYPIFNVSSENIAYMLHTFLVEHIMFLCFMLDNNKEFIHSELSILILFWQILIKNKKEDARSRKIMCVCVCVCI